MTILRGEADPATAVLTRESQVRFLVTVVDRCVFCSSLAVEVPTSRQVS